MRKSTMRMLGAVLLCAGITAAVVGGAGARPVAAAGDDSAVLQADQAFVAAVRTADKAALGQLLDADFSWTDVDGRMLTRAAALQEMPKPLTNGGGSAPITTHVYGDVALVRIDDGLVHVLRVWVKRPSGWKTMVYQEVRSLTAPPTVTPGPAQGCENPCRDVLYQPKNDVERGVIKSYMGLETASVGHDAPNWGPHVAEEFVAVSSYSNKLLTKTDRMADLAKSEMRGLSPTPVVTMKLVDFGDTVVMLSKQQPDKGKPLQVTRVWIKRDGNWVIVVAFQTAIQAESGRS
jgi:hypothetical protein